MADRSQTELLGARARPRAAWDMPRLSSRASNLGTPPPGGMMPWQPWCLQFGPLKKEGTKGPWHGWLVGGWKKTNEKIWKSVGMMRFPIFLGKYKMATKPPTRWVVSIFVWLFHVVGPCWRIKHHSFIFSRGLTFINSVLTWQIQHLGFNREYQKNGICGMSMTFGKVYRNPVFFPIQLVRRVFMVQFGEMLKKTRSRKVHIINWSLPLNLALLMYSSCFN